MKLGLDTSTETDAGVEHRPGLLIVPAHALTWILVGALAGCTVTNSVEDDPEDDRPANIWRDDPSERSKELWVNPGDNLLAALVEVEQNDLNQVLPANNQVLGAVLGEAGHYFSALTTFQPTGDAFLPQEEECDDSDLPDAVEELCERIVDNPDDDEDQDGEQIVFINTLPHAPFHRSMVRKILSCAREAGYSYLAIEELEEDAAALTARGYVSRTTSGAALREPQMARLIEDGLALEFQLVNFDVGQRCEACGFVETINERADRQAENLIAKTIGVDPAARVLVVAGPFQSFKEPWGQSEPYTTSLARRVWDVSGLEPYGIDQVAIDLPALPFGVSSPSPPSGMYMASGPNNGRCMGQYAPSTPTGVGALNTVIVHVPPRTDERRWDWLRAPAEERRTITPTCAACEPTERLFVQAFRAGVDTADRVAIDQTLCGSGEACEMVLPAGSYQVFVWSEEALVGSGPVDLTATSSASLAL